MLAVMAALCLEAKTPVRDADVWWHLSVGNWIVQHHAFPHVGIFSRTAATRPWLAYSWGFEVLLSRSYAWFGLIGLASFGVLLTLAVAIVLFWMSQRLCGSYWLAWLLSLVGCFAFLFSLMPRPVFFTMMFFMVLLTLLLEAHRSGHVQSLYWLPLVFMLWANFHIQFVYGLAVLGLYVGINMAQRLAERFGCTPELLVAPTLPVKPLLAVMAASALACCIGPYSWHPFQVAIEYASARVPYELIQELQPLGFRSFTEYVLVLLIAAAFYALGSQKKVDVFKLSLLVVASLSAFRTSRDAWLVAVCAVAFIADLREVDCTPRRPVLRHMEMAVVGVVTAVLLFLVGANTGFTTRELDRSISRDYPVNAVNYLRRNPMPGPLYNNFDWGGFLIWYMPQYPVAIDGRTDLYGDEADLMTFKSAAGEYASDRYLQESRLVLLPKKLPLAKLLTVDPEFRVVYEDQLAIVFARN
jgi:hypothetical protein